jgi:hypothetical protein
VRLRRLTEMRHRDRPLRFQIRPHPPCQTGRALHIGSFFQQNFVVVEVEFVVRAGNILVRANTLARFTNVHVGTLGLFRVAGGAALSFLGHVCV